MDDKKKKQMAIMVDAVQPSCDEKIIAAMTCSHAGSMGSLLVSKFLSGGGGLSKTRKVRFMHSNMCRGDLSSRSKKRLRVGLGMKLL